MNLHAAGCDCLGCGLDRKLNGAIATEGGRRKPTADRMTIEALRGVLEQIADTAQNASDEADKYSQRTLLEIKRVARRALAATEER